MSKCKLLYTTARSGKGNDEHFLQEKNVNAFLGLLISGLSQTLIGPAAGEGGTSGCTVAELANRQRAS